MQKLSTKPLKGFRDFTPEDWRIQKYIFNIWESVCEKYGYDEYNGPVLEYTDIYNKSGDDVGTRGKELYAFEDRGGRSIALRPEMTPTVGRMVAEYGKKYSKPIRWYSIAQFFRAENPQRGRGREFFQLNFDIFGADSLLADVEILKMAIDIMLEYGAKPEMFTLRLNNRKLMNSYLLSILGDELSVVPVIRIIDKLKKVGTDTVKTMLFELGLDNSKVQKIEEYLSLSEDVLTDLSGVDGASEMSELLKLLRSTKYSQYIKFDATLARGFDYYTGMVFEVFDNNPNNNRSMFGGGRYDNLVDMFSNEKISAVGCAPGDVAARLFLESWDLLPSLSVATRERYYIPLLVADTYGTLLTIGDKLREEGKSVIIGVDVENVSKALSNANKNGYQFVILFGQDEISKNEYKLKNMQTGKEEIVNFK